MEFRILGALEAEFRGVRVRLSGPRERGALAALALSVGQMVPVWQLVDALWDDDPPATAAKQAQNAVSRLRHALGRAGAPDVIVTVAGGYRLDPDKCIVDARMFEAGVAAADRAASEGRIDVAAGLLREALALWRGPALAGLTGQDFESAAQALEERRFTARETCLGHELALGRHREVLGELAGLTAGNPFRERLAGLYMLALYRCGRQADALAAYQGTRQALAGELGLDPGGELRGLHQQMLTADPALAPPAGPAVPRLYSADGRTWTDGVAPQPLAGVSGVVESPYRGLAAFEEQDAAFFFGRDQLTANVLGRMAGFAAGAGLLVVSGVSGAGKSSLLRAGVLPSLRAGGLAGAPGSRRWPCVVFNPGSDPLDELAVRVASLAGADATEVRRGLEEDPSAFALMARQAALAGQPGPDGPEATAAIEPPARLLLVVDQFEQVLTRCPDERERRAFVAALHAAATAHGTGEAPAALVVLVVRADFEAPCAGFEELAQAVQDRYLVTPMTARQLELAITEPARLAGAAVDDRLVRTLLDQARTRHGDATWAGVLPLVSHAMDQAWRRRAGTTLTLADYERAGGIEGAVAASAQRAYDQLTPAQQQAARLVFTRLTATTSDGTDVAARATMAELTSGMTASGHADVQAVLDAFTAERLLTVGADHAEISHEALLTAWPLLRDTWLAETHADRITRTKLTTVANEWDRQHRDSSYLYAGRLLHAAADTAARVSADPTRYPALTITERDFLHASHRVRHRAARLRRSAVAALAALAVGLAATTALVVRANRQVTYQRDVAIAEEMASKSREIGDGNPALARLLALAAWRLSPSALATRQAWLAMLSAAALPGIRHFGSNFGQVQSVAFSPDGKLLASGSLLGTVRLWHVATGQPADAPLTADSADQVRSVAFSPDGKLLASGGADGVALWHVAGGLSATGVALTFRANSVTFSPDGKLLASGGAHGVRLWDVATGRSTGVPFTGRHLRPVRSVAFSPDGMTLASGGADGLRLWHVATGQPIGAPLTGGPVLSVAFSPDGTTLASGGADGTIRLWQVATGQQIGTVFTGSRADPVQSVMFSPDGTTLASAETNGPGRLWHVATAQAAGAPLTASRNGPVYSVAFSPDDTTLASGGGDGIIRLWDVATGRPVGALLTASRAGPVNSVAFSPDGGILASGSDDGKIRLWDVATGQQIGAVFTGSRIGPVNSVAFSPDGTILASGGTDGTIRLWHMAAGKPVGAPIIASSVAQVFSAAFSPDGTTLASGSDDGKVHLWHVATGRLVGAPLAGSRASAVYSVAFSPDGTTLASGTDSVRLWHVATGQPADAPLTASSAEVVDSVAFSPDGTTLAGAISFPTFSIIRLWHVATGQLVGTLMPSQTSQIMSVAFSPDSTILASGDEAGRVRMWNVSYVTNTVAYLCALAGRSLTRAEWARYVSPGIAYQAVCP